MGTRAKPATDEQTKDQIIAGLRELLDMQSQLLEEKDRRIAALERAAANRDRRRDRTA